MHDVGFVAKSSLCKKDTMIRRAEDFYKFLTKRFLEVERLCSGAKISVHFSRAKGLDKILKMNRLLV